MSEIVNPTRWRRVAYVVADPGIPVFGTKGASVHVQEIVRAWRRRGAHVEVFTVRRGDEVPADLADVPVHVVRLEKTGTDAAARERAQQVAALRLAEMVAEYAPDVVYERYSLFSDVLHTVRESTGCVGVLEVNSPLVDEQRIHRVLVDQEGAERITRMQFGAADVVACVSRQVAGWLAGRVPEGSDTVVAVVPNGVNTERITPSPADPAAPVVVFVGTLKPWHGVADLVEAAALARRPWRLRVVGDGPQRGEMQELAARHGLDIEFTGAVPPARVPEHLHGAAVAVAPYPDSADHYFSPLKVYEYGAAGLPTVASGIGQIPDVVTDGETGVLVPPSDPAALAAAVDDLVADPARAAALGAAARERMVRGHSWDAVLNRSLEPIAG